MIRSAKIKTYVLLALHAICYVCIISTLLSDAVARTNEIEQYYTNDDCFLCLAESIADSRNIYEFGQCNEIYAFNLTAGTNTMKNGKLVSLKLSSMVQYYIFNSIMMLVIMVLTYLLSVKLLYKEKGELIVYTIQGVCYGLFFLEAYTALSVSLVYSLSNAENLLTHNVYKCYILAYSALFIIFCKLMLFILFVSNFTLRLVPEKYKKLLYVCEIFSAFALCIGCVINIAYTVYYDTAYSACTAIIIINFAWWGVTLGFYTHIKKLIIG